jgi:hypothetical protein
MSISNATAHIQPGREVVLSAHQPSELTGPKFTAADIEKDCPVRLREISSEIGELYGEARQQAKRLDDHVIAINKLISEAQDRCDVGGYDKFRELFCPQLGKSQAYVRLAIAAGKTTLVERRQRLELQSPKKVAKDAKNAKFNWQWHNLLRPFRGLVPIGDKVARYHHLPSPPPAHDRSTPSPCWCSTLKSRRL